MPTAYVHLPIHVGERREAFINGFAKLGFNVHQHQPHGPMNPQDVAVVWNLTGRSNQSADMAAAGGGALLVTENGYYDGNGQKAYALALDGHNGSGRWFAGDRHRLDRLNIDFKPLRPNPTSGRVLVAAQRGIGSQRMRSPYDFDQRIRSEIESRQQGRFEVRVREHPGRHQPQRPLAEDLQETDALVVWSSNCATSALIEGIPTYYCAPTIVTANAARQFHKGFPVEPTTEETRQEVFQRMAWAQWFLDEIESGEAFDTLLSVHRGRLEAYRAAG